MRPTWASSPMPRRSCEQLLAELDRRRIDGAAAARRNGTRRSPAGARSGRHFIRPGFETHTHADPARAHRRRLPRGAAGRRDHLARFRHPPQLVHAVLGGAPAADACSTPGAIPAWASARAAILGAKLAAPDRPASRSAATAASRWCRTCCAPRSSTTSRWSGWSGTTSPGPRSATCSTPISTAARSAPPSTRGPTGEPYNPDFAAWARAAGVDGYTVTRSQDFAGVLEQAVALEQAGADRRPRRRRDPAARHRRLGAAADPAQGAGVRSMPQPAAMPTKPGDRVGRSMTIGKSRAPRAVIRNIAEEPWKQFPAHYGGALSKALVRPETTGSRQIDYRISTYQPMAYVEPHAHKVQEQVYHVLDGEGLMEIDGRAPRGAPARRDLPAARRRALDPQHRPRRPRVPRHHLAARRRVNAVRPSGPDGRKLPAHHGRPIPGPQSPDPSRVLLVTPGPRVTVRSAVPSLEPEDDRGSTRQAGPVDCRVKPGRVRLTFA